MAKRKAKKKGEQLDLIDVQPKDGKAIVDAARIYKKLQGTRVTALSKEIEQKQRVLNLVKAAKLQPLAGGKIKFKYDDVTISVTPRDELVKVEDEANKE